MTIYNFFFYYSELPSISKIEVSVIECDYDSDYAASQRLFNILQSQVIPSSTLQSMNDINKNGVKKYFGEAADTSNLRVTVIVVDGMRRDMIWKNNIAE